MRHINTHDQYITFDHANPPSAGTYRALLDNGKWCDAIATYQHQEFSGWEIACSNIHPDASIVGYEPN